MKWNETALAPSLFLAATSLLSACRANDSKNLTYISVASSAERAVADALLKTGPWDNVHLNTGASSSLARHILAGAPANLFVTAHPRWANAVESKTSMKRLLFRSNIVLAGDNTRFPTGRVCDILTRTKALVAIGDPDSVPLGLYTKAALTSLGCYKNVEHRLVATKDAASAVALLARAEVNLAFVYRTDVRNDFQVLGQLENVPVEYEVLVLHPASQRSRSLFAALTSSVASDAYKSLGFRPGLERHNH